MANKTIYLDDDGESIWATAKKFAETNSASMSKLVTRLLKEYIETKSVKPITRELFVTSCLILDNLNPVEYVISAHGYGRDYIRLQTNEPIDMNTKIKVTVERIEE